MEFRYFSTNTIGFSKSFYQFFLDYYPYSSNEVMDLFCKVKVSLRGKVEVSSDISLSSELLLLKSAVSVKPSPNIPSD